MKAILLAGGVRVPGGPRGLQNRSGGASSQAGSIPVRLRVEKTWSDRGVRKAPRFLPSLAFRSGGGLAQPPSADVRVGSRRRRAEAGRHRALGAWGCRVGSHHPRPPSCRAHSFSARRVSSSWREFRRALSPRERRAVRTAVRAQEAGCEPGGPVSTVGTYSSSWSLPSNVRLATISRVTSGYPS